MNNHALLEQREMAFNYRNVGLGIMGMHDMFIKMGRMYGDESSKRIINAIMDDMFQTAVMASNELAKTKGAFPKCVLNDDRIINSEIIKNHKYSFEPWELQSIKKYGLRNCSLLSIAPSGSIGTMLNISTGCEPHFQLSYTRKTESLNDGKEKYYSVDVDVVQNYLSNKNLNELNGTLPYYFNTSADIKWKDRIDMQSILQQHIDTAISSTVNLPEETTIEEIEQLYLYAYQKKLKGITIFRNNCKRLGILTTNDNSKKKGIKSNDISNKELPTLPTEVSYNQITPVSRKTIGMTHGNTYCKKCACGTLYITVNRDEDGNVVETFVHTSKGGICQANSSAVTRLSSLALRSGVKVEEIADQLKGITCTACAKLMAKGEKIDGVSCPDILSKTIMEFYKTNDIVSAVPVFEDTQVEKYENNNSDDSSKFCCPECGEPIAFTEGCVKCTSCAWSKCN